ncbi:hypothetical protein SAMN05216327_111213 [Dyadobacter sp. SG02]|uniref:hypothetical protein n=1 Tax=Dyadobacter sp. SG02 TaxID=1855291 RepID=UPI0008CE9CC2|nr:hypothetical protein [Dyadobacter sp. SG02]SEJ50413.1 hypothetical protein SAMN05216327_111213 [Dyadobacter sp. SG02]
MKTQASTQTKLQLVKFTVARLNGISKTGGNKDFIQVDTTHSTMSCRTILI